MKRSLRWLIVLLLCLSLVPLTPVSADNCSGLSDCFRGNLIPALLLLLGLILLIAATWYFWPIIAPVLGRFFFGTLLRGLIGTGGRSAIGRAIGNAIARFSGLSRVGFAPGRWLPHFVKHGSEFGFRNSIQYLRAAQRLFSGGRGVQTFTRANGDKLFYRAATNEFGAITRDGVIRTFFKPQEGLTYWLRQIGGI